MLSGTKKEHHKYEEKFMAEARSWLKYAKKYLNRAGAGAQGASDRREGMTGLASAIYYLGAAMAEGQWLADDREGRNTEFLELDQEINDLYAEVLYDLTKR